MVSTQFITRVNGVETKNLEDFAKAIKGLNDGEYVRVKVCSFDLVPAVLSIKLNLHYFPSGEMFCDKNGEWKKGII